MTTDWSLNYKFNTLNFKAQTWWEHVVYRNCFWHSEHFFLHNMISPYSDKDLPVWRKLSTLFGKTGRIRVGYGTIKTIGSIGSSWPKHNILLKKTSKILTIILLTWYNNQFRNYESEFSQTSWKFRTRNSGIGRWIQCAKDTIHIQLKKY